MRVSLLLVLLSACDAAGPSGVADSSGCDSADTAADDTGREDPCGNRRCGRDTRCVEER